MSAAPPAAPPTKKHKHDEEDDKPLVPKDEDDPDKPLVPQDPDTTSRAGEPVCIIFYTRVDDGRDMNDQKTDYSRIPLRCLTQEQLAMLQEWRENKEYPVRGDEGGGIRAPVKRPNETDEKFAARLKVYTEGVRTDEVVAFVKRLVDMGEPIDADAFVGRHDVQMVVELLCF